MSNAADTTIDLASLLSVLGPRCAQDREKRDTDAAFVAENYALLRDNGIFSALVPSAYGGGGASHRQMCAFVRGLAHHCSSTALALSMHQHLVAAAVYNDANGRPGRKVLDKVVAGGVLVSTGANDWMASNGEVEAADGGYHVSARKAFASGSPAGDVLVTSAPYHHPVEGWQVLHFPVPMKAAGVSLAGDWDTLGMRATGSQTVVLERVFVPEEAIALKRPRGPYHPAWNVIITVAMPLIMSAYLGVAERAAEIARTQAMRRADDPATPWLLGELAQHLTAAQMAVDAMIAITDDFAFENGVATADGILVRKTIAAKAVLATVEKALETAGGAGFYTKLGLERLVRDAHGAQFHPLPEKRQLLFTGRLALGLDPIGEGDAATGSIARAA